MSRFRLSRWCCRYFALLALALLLLPAIYGCGSRAKPEPVLSDTAVALPADPARLAELESQLAAEFERLGIDPSKVPAAAPQGERNAVFDLAAQVVDGEGQPWEPGGDAPAGIELRWTERLLGDYDQNGEVNAADLVPIASRFNDTVSYDDPAMHGAFAEWPTGDPEGPGAANWRAARVDGDGNEEINAADIVPLAGHFREILSGYRIYRRLAGQSAFELLRQQGQPLLLPRPDVSANAPVRYAFLDEPPVAGEYEYYVVAVKAQASTVEASHHSNIAGAEIEVGFADTLPPIWDDAVGLQGYIDNGDGTATLSWGTATDVAPLGVTPREPVTYTVYWSTQSPLDYEKAAVAELATSPWTSPQLLSGTPYYFAVRASDSADPPNTEQNTAELEVSVTGGTTQDTDPPVWVEINPETEKLIKGIREIEPLDGKLRIVHAVAEDALSPPVHYDLYVISDQIADSVLDENDEIHPEAQLFSDILPVFELAWENRDAAHLLVRARDSAAVPNIEENDNVINRAPGAFTRQIIDPNIPGIYPETKRIWEDKAVDHAKQKAYFAYYTTGDNPNDRTELWFINLDLKTGTWTSRLLQSAGPGNRITAGDLGLSWTGDVWILGAEQSPGIGTEVTFHILRNTGAWEQWEATKPPAGWYNKNFDHNGNPLMLGNQQSAVQQDRAKLIYLWWDSATQAWIDEVAVDPGSVYSRAFVRPDGTVQLLVRGEDKPFGDKSPTKGRLAERSPSGEWTLIYEIDDLGSSMQGNMATWGHEVAWSGFAGVDGVYLALLYGNSGYSLVELPIFNGEQLYGRYWSTGNSQFHILTNYVLEDSGYFKQSFFHDHYAAQYERDKLHDFIQSGLRVSAYDPVSGAFANVSVEPNLLTGQYQWILQRPATGKSLFVR